MLVARPQTDATLYPPVPHAISTAQQCLERGLLPRMVLEIDPNLRAARTKRVERIKLPKRGLSSTRSASPWREGANSDTGSGLGQDTPVRGGTPPQVCPLRARAHLLANAWTGQPGDGAGWRIEARPYAPIQASTQQAGRGSGTSGPSRRRVCCTEAVGVLTAYPRTMGSVVGSEKPRTATTRLSTKSRLA